MRPRLSTKSLALTVVFAALYATLSFLPLFPLIGAQGKFIQAGNVLAPLMGIVLGPWLGVFAIAVGGSIDAFLPQTGSFGPLSFLPHLATALCGGLLYNNKRWVCGAAYSLLIVAFAFYPVVGPAWLWPLFLWLHVVGLALMFSPLQPKANRFIREDKEVPRLALGFGVTSFLAALFGHAVGTLMFEATYWPILIDEVEAWLFNWQALTLLYPIERGLIAVFSTAIGVGVLRALRAYGFEVGG
jgi:uncharacterized membrane protein